MKTFIIFAFLLLSFPVFSQKNSFGFKAGYVNSWIGIGGFSSYPEFSKRNSFSAGIFYNREISTIFSFQPEVLYSQKGYSYTYYTPNNITVNYHSNYIEAPILLKASAVSMSTFSPFLNTGICPSLKINSTYKSTRSFDLGLIASVGVDISVSEKLTLLIESRINIGLANNRAFYVFSGLSF